VSDYAAEADTRRKRQSEAVAAFRKLGLAAVRHGASSVSLSLEDAERVLARLLRKTEAGR
jgi:hypothetical protein